MIGEKISDLSYKKELMGGSPEIILLRQNESETKHKTPNHQTKTITKCTYSQDYTWKVFKLYLGPEAHNYWERESRVWGPGTPLFAIHLSAIIATRWVSPSVH